MSKIGEQIRKFRTWKKLTQEQLADQVGVSTGYISHIERNERDIDTELVRKIANVLGVSISALFDENIQSPGIVSEPNNVAYNGNVQISFSMPGNITPEMMNKIKDLAQKIGEAPEDDGEMIISLADRILTKK